MGSLKTFIGLILYKIAPIKDNTFVFTSFNGHYSDNTRSISEKLHEIHPDAEIVWLLLPGITEIPEYIKSVRYGSLKSYWIRGRATIQIDNVYGFRANFIFDNSLKTKMRIWLFEKLGNKRKQPIIATMHGTAFKKIGRAQIGNNVIGFSCPNTYLIVGDKYTEEKLDYITFEQCSMGILGWPRNDLLFNCNRIKTREKLRIPVEKKVLLFAPTFRNDGKDTECKNLQRSGLNQLNELDFDCLFDELSKKFGGEWIMVCRFHYHVANQVDWEELEIKYPGKFINGNKSDDMAEYLASSDILLTDASSSMFDYANTGRPCFLFFPDYENYRDSERGFYYDIKTLPFSLATDFNGLVNSIRTFDNDRYQIGIKKLLEKIGSMDDGKSSERFVDFLWEKKSNGI